MCVLAGVVQQSWSGRLDAATRLHRNLRLDYQATPEGPVREGPFGIVADGRREGAAGDSAAKRRALLLQENLLRSLVYG